MIDLAFVIGDIGLHVIDVTDHLDSFLVERHGRLSDG
jgi:hypothetical protein